MMRSFSQFLDKFQSFYGPRLTHTVVLDLTRVVLFCTFVLSFTLCLAA